MAESNLPPRPSTCGTMTEEEFKNLSVFNEDQVDVIQLLKEKAEGAIVDNVVVLIDTDIPVYKVASIADRVYYTVDGSNFKYHKEAVAFCKSVDLDPKKHVIKAINPMTVDQVTSIFDSSMKNLFDRFPGASIFHNILSGRNNFRYEIYPEYKAYRKKIKPPVHRQFLHDYAASVYNGVIYPTYEADDTIGFINQSHLKSGLCTPVIVTVDKDLNMLPGWHYNPDKNSLFYIDELQGFRLFCEQVLKGDSTDGIPGIKGLGPKTATKLLRDCDSMESMWQTVVDTYEAKKHDEEYLHQMASMIWIRRSPTAGYREYITQKVYGGK